MKKDNYERGSSKSDLLLDYPLTMQSLVASRSQRLISLTFPSTDDRRQINSVKKMQDFAEVFNHLNTENNDFGKSLEDLRQLSVVDMRFKKNREVIYEYDGTFESFIELIYQVRCNLFPGRKNVDEDQKDIELVSLAYRILLPLFKAYLSSELITGTD